MTGIIKDQPSGAARTARAPSESSQSLVERRYQALMQGTTLVVWVANPAGDIIEISKCVDVTGLPEECFYGWAWREILHPEDKERIEAQWRHSVATLTPYEAELRARDKDGCYHDLLAQAVPVLDDTGQAYEWVGCFRDITEKKQAETALRRSEQNYRDLFESANDVILMVDARGDILDINPHGERLTGYNRQELLAMNVLRDLIVTDDRETIIGVLRELIAGANQRYEVRWRARDGRVLEFEGSSSPRSDAQGHFLSTRCILRDVTARKQAEAALRESERWFREFLENLNMLAIILDPKGRILFCNDFLTRMTGWRREELLGRNWFDSLVPKEIRAKAFSAFLTCMQARKDRPNPLEHIENTIFTREGKERLISWDNSLLYSPDGRAIGCASLGRDITDQRHLEEQYRHAQKLEALGQLAGGIAHDFNNLLQVIGGFLEIAMAKLIPGQSPHSELVPVEQAAQRATGLVRQLLAFSRRETMKCEDLALDRVIADVAKMLRRILGTHIELETLANGPLPLIHADAGQIEQVLLNLCVNARDAMPDGGRLSLETRRARLAAGHHLLPEAAPGGDYVQLSVRDTGSGMSPQVREHLFEPFFTTKGEGKGTGLGLATVYGIIKQHDGLIDVESAPGQGSTFHLYFPVHDGRQADHDPEKKCDGSAASGQGGSGRILLAEDDELVCDLASRVLTDAGYDVLTAGDGEAAIELLEAENGRFDLYILDVIMPRKTGRVVYEAIVSRCPEARVLFSSGYNCSAADLGVAPGDTFHLLPKPYSPNELLTRVRDLLEH